MSTSTLSIVSSCTPSIPNSHLSISSCTPTDHVSIHPSSFSSYIVHHIEQIHSHTIQSLKQSYLELKEKQNIGALQCSPLYVDIISRWDECCLDTVSKQYVQEESVVERSDTSESSETKKYLDVFSGVEIISTPNQQQEENQNIVESVVVCVESLIQTDASSSSSSLSEMKYMIPLFKLVYDVSRDIWILPHQINYLPFKNLCIQLHYYNQPTIPKKVTSDKLGILRIHGYTITQPSNE